MKNRFQQTRQIFIENGGILRTAQAVRLGIKPYTLHIMREQGELDRIERGLYRLAHLPSLDHPDLVIVASRIPRSVICLISALFFHDITTQIPHEIYIALPKQTKKPRLTYPPIRYFWISPNAYQEGIETHSLNGVDVRIYCKAKTVADSFKFRHKIGTDVAIEALKLYLSTPYDIDQLLAFARTNRVENIITPYLETLL